MTAISKVFLDLDDTLNSFTLFVLGQMGADIGPYEYHRYPDVGYDVIKALAVMTGQELTPADFWGHIPREIWANAPRSPEFDRIVTYCEELVGLDNTYILTSPTLCPESCAGKLVWIQREWPCPRNFFIGPHKGVIARPDYLLIDDSMRHIDSWNAAGGQTLVMPRPWNCSNHANPFFQ